jgi:hypothetical protein
MSKNIITIVSVILVIVGSVFAYSYLNKGQENTQLDILSLPKVNNTASFLWIDERQDETVFYMSGIEMESTLSDTNPYFDMLFNIKDITNNNYSSAGFSFSTEIGSFTDNNLRVYHNDLSGDTEIKVKVKINTNIVDEGNYFLDLQLNEGSFDLAEINNGVDVRLELEVNEKPHPLQVWLSILLVILLLAICAWFLLLKKAYFPTFSKKGQLNISAPDASIIFLKKNARKLIFGSIIKEKENFLTKLFYGEIQYVLAASGHSAVITPYKDWKTKKILYRLSCKGDTNSEIINSVSYLKHHDKYTLRTDDEKISFEYFNIKHQ